MNPDTVRSFNYIYVGLKLQGIFLTKNNRCYQKILFITNIIVVNILYPSSYVIQLFFLNNIRELLDNIPMNLSLVACSIKFFFLQRMRLQLIEINRILRELDNSQSMTDPQKIKLEKTIFFCRKVSLMLAGLFFVVNIVPCINAMMSDTKLIYEIWLPYNWSRSTFRHDATVWTQLLLQLQLSLQNVANDLIGPLYLVVLDTHLEIIMERFACLHYDPNKTEADGYKDFVQYVENHGNIMKIFDVIQNNVSPMIFIQFIASILVVSSSGVKHMIFSIESNEVFAIVLLMFGVMAEIFPSCYYSNKFMNTTNQFVFSIYSSNWIQLSPRFRKMMIIFMQMTQQKKVVMAGKLIPITLATFLSMVKTTYSVATIMGRFA